jgi:uncharacterized membrane protein YeiH
VMRSEIYVTAAALGAGVSLLCLALGLPEIAAMFAGFLAGFLLRLAALRFNWSLPTSPKA